MPVKRDIVYPVFLECCVYAPDPFWESVFEDLAFGKCPYGTYISKDFFCCSQKKKEFSYKIETKSPSVIYDEVYSLLTKKLCLLSQKDRSKKKTALLASKDDKDSHTDWSSIRKKSYKDMCIEKFVICMKDRHCLSIKQARYLLSVIVLAFVFKVLTAKNVEYSEGKITSIEGITFDQGVMHISEELTSVDARAVPAAAEERKFMSDAWDKYIKDLRKIEK